MTIASLTAVRLRGKKDTVLARQRARRIAGLLQFDPHEQACIAAGAFVIACQAIAHFAKPRLCFQLENQQLQIFAEEANGQLTPAANPVADRLTGLFAPADAKGLYRLTKPLPGDAVAAVDLNWLVRSVEAEAPANAFDEVVRQNQEILALLHEIRLYQRGAQEKPEKSTPSHAA
jgi:hypothetical protein